MVTWEIIPQLVFYNLFIQIITSVTWGSQVRTTWNILIYCLWVIQSNLAPSRSYVMYYKYKIFQKGNETPEIVHIHWTDDTFIHLWSFSMPIIIIHNHTVNTVNLSKVLSYFYFVRYYKKAINTGDILIGDTCVAGDPHLTQNTWPPPPCRYVCYVLLLNLYVPRIMNLKLFHIY